ncbi:MAG: hypothetical protein K5908_02380, partial [Erysipelotrichaceae bacterium]|nr:hypothetical protein [Erysipelotrichaceae bacterium]
SDGSRANGNRSRLMNFYFSEDRNFLSDPDWMLEDDGTADYDPYVYRSDNDNNAYVVWRNGTKAFDEDSTIEEIAANSDIWFAKHQVSREWISASRVTNLGSGENRVFATGAKVFDGKDGSPVVAYYLNDVSDPLGLNESYSHDACKASREDAYSPWNNEKLFSVSGAITEMDASVFDGKETYAVSYHEADENGKKVYKLAMYQDGEKVFERSNAVNGRFVKYGNSNAMLTWFENNSLYGFSDTAGDKVHKITPDDMKVPTADYDISGRFASGSIVLTGTVSKDSTEKIYAIFSNDGGQTWTKTILNGGEEFAYVNESAMAFTKEDEPILFYSVQNYEINFDEERLNASNYVNGDASLSAVNSVQMLRLADDDPRFTDTQTDLYVRARKANQKVEIIGGSFDDEDSARKGKMIPFTLEIENKGLYGLDRVTLFNDCVKLGDFEVDLAAGEKTEVKGEVLLPENCSDDGVIFRFGASSHNDVVESEKDVTLGTGHIRVVYDHTLVYQTENLDYLITNKGYCTKDVYIYVYDGDSGEQIHSEHLVIPAGHTMNGTYSAGLESLWRQKGHKNVKACIVMDGEQIEDLDSTRTVSFGSLEEIYIQDFSGLYKTSTPDPVPSGNNDVPVYDHEPIEGSYKLPVTYVSEKETGTAVKEEEKKTEEKPETEAVQTPEHAVEQNETEEKAEETVPRKNRSFLGFIILAAALGIGFLLFLLFGILRRREEEEE